MNLYYYTNHSFLLSKDKKSFSSIERYPKRLVLRDVTKNWKILCSANDRLSFTKFLFTNVR